MTEKPTKIYPLKERKTIKEKQGEEKKTKKYEPLSQRPTMPDTPKTKQGEAIKPLKKKKETFEDISEHEIEQALGGLDEQPPLEKISEQDIEMMLEEFENEKDIEEFLANLDDEKAKKIVDGWEAGDKEVALKLQTKGLSDKDILRMFFMANTGLVKSETAMVKSFSQYARKKYPELFKEENKIKELRQELRGEENKKAA